MSCGNIVKMEIEILFHRRQRYTRHSQFVVPSQPCLAFVYYLVKIPPVNNSTELWFLPDPLKNSEMVKGVKF